LRRICRSTPLLSRIPRESIKSGLVIGILEHRLKI
jgi:hypothetical protein